jgi:hypothetical protein
VRCFWCGGVRLQQWASYHGWCLLLLHSIVRSLCLMCSSVLLACNRQCTTVYMHVTACLTPLPPRLGIVLTVLHDLQHAHQGPLYTAAGAAVRYGECCLGLAIGGCCAAGGAGSAWRHTCHLMPPLHTFSGAVCSPCGVLLLVEPWHDRTAQGRGSTTAVQLCAFVQQTCLHSVPHALHVCGRHHRYLGC